MNPIKPRKEDKDIKKSALYDLLAVAIKYKEELDSAPKVIAKGTGDVAKKIIEIAKEKGIPIKEDKALGQLLYKIDLDDTIPEELYKAVAEVLAFIYLIEQKQTIKS